MRPNTLLKNCIYTYIHIHTHLNFDSPFKLTLKLINYILKKKIERKEILSKIISQMKTLMGNFNMNERVNQLRLLYRYYTVVTKIKIILQNLSENILDPLELHFVRNQMVSLHYILRH